MNSAREGLAALCATLLRKVPNSCSRSKRPERRALVLTTRRGHIPRGLPIQQRLATGCMSNTRPTSHGSGQDHQIPNRAHTQPRDKRHISIRHLSQETSLRRY